MELEGQYLLVDGGVLIIKRYHERSSCGDMTVLYLNYIDNFSLNLSELIKLHPTISNYTYIKYNF
jgi:hypothetical protein